MSNCDAYNCTVIGQRYIEKEKLCEDCSASYNEGEIHIAVVADGHGDSNCFRSNIGSEAACAAAVEQMKKFARALRDEESEHTIFTRLGARKLIDNLFLSILNSWKEDVLADFDNNPPSDDEYEQVEKNTAALYRSGKELTHIYGTTLIAALMTEKFLLIIHQGDGRCVVIHSNGEVDQPVPWDPNCVGRNTTSLCDKNVLAGWRYHLINLENDPIAACYVISDGIEDSFENMDELNAYLCMHACDYSEKGKESYLEELPSHFAELTKNGSRDDISIGCIIDAEAIGKFIPRFRQVHRYHVAKAENRKAVERINSMERKTEFLGEQLKRAQNEYDRVCNEEEKNKKSISKVQQVLNLLLNKVDVFKENKIVAEQKLISAKAEYNDYMDLRESFAEKAEQTQKLMDEAEREIRLLSDCGGDEESLPSGNAAESFVYTQPVPDISLEYDDNSDEFPDFTTDSADTVTDE